MMTKLIIDRIYDKAPQPDYRILTDRLWPRGISKEHAALDLWAKDIAPTNELRKWFGHDPEKYADFKQKYLDELKDNDAAADFVATVKEQLKGDQDVILLYGAKDEEHNQAVVLQEWLQDQL